MIKTEDLKEAVEALRYAETGGVIVPGDELFREARMPLIRELRRRAFGPLRSLRPSQAVARLGGRDGAITRPSFWTPARMVACAFSLCLEDWRIRVPTISAPPTTSWSRR